MACAHSEDLTKNLSPEEMPLISDGKVSCDANVVLKSSKKERRMSFSSAVMALDGGAMPSTVNFNPVIIEALVSFASLHDCPETDDIVPLVIKFLTSADRMAGIPKKYGCCKPYGFRFEPCDPDIGDPKRMIRTFDVNHDSIAGMVSEVKKLEKNSDDLISEERNLPWWEFCLFRNSGQSESMLVLRVHHCIGDGLSIGLLSSRVMTHLDGSPVVDLIPPSMRAAKSSTSMQGKTESFSVWKKVKNSFAALTEVALVWSGRWDSPTVFSKNVVGSKHYARDRKMLIFDSYPVDYIKEIRKKANASFSEVLNAAMGQAIHDYCQHHDCPVMKKLGESVMCRASMTVGFPSEHENNNNTLHNTWSPVHLDMGVGIKCVKSRLQHIQKRMAFIKTSPLVPFTLGLQNILLPKLPVFLSRKIIHSTYAKYSFTSSCVPGPSHPILVAGKPVSACRFSASNVAPILSILTYNGQVYTTFTLDEKIMPGVDEFPSFYTKALVKLGKEFQVEIPQKLLEIEEESKV